MRSKATVRYLDFTSAPDGSRIFHFSISTGARDEAYAMVEMPIEFMIGLRRIPFPDCARISYTKLQQVMDADGSKAPRRLRLNAADILEFRPPRTKSRDRARMH